MKVYLVTHGDYSDYQINAVFSTRKKAEEFTGNAPSEHFGIEEWELDVERPRVWGPFW